MLTLLGTGHHSNVYSLTKDYYIKVAFADDANLEKEVCVLKAFEKTNCVNLPRVIFSSLPNFFIGSPCATPLFHVLVDATLEERNRWADIVSEDLHKALSAAHSVNVAHLNIKPDNVVINCEGRAVLIDWAESSPLFTLQKKKHQNGWRSSKIEEPGDTWYVLPEHDTECVQYTVAAIRHGSVTRHDPYTPWLGIEFIEPVECLIARGRDMWLASHQYTLPPPAGGADHFQSTKSPAHPPAPSGAYARIFVTVYPLTLNPGAGIEPV